MKTKRGLLPLEALPEMWMRRSEREARERARRRRAFWADVREGAAGFAGAVLLAAVAGALAWFYLKATPAQSSAEAEFWEEAAK